MDFVALELPTVFCTVNLTVYFPAVLYVCTGLLTVECVVPSPKSQFQLCIAGLPVLWSVKYTVRGATPDTGVAEKSAIVEFVDGAALTQVAARTENE